MAGKGGSEGDVKVHKYLRVTYGRQAATYASFFNWHLDLAKERAWNSLSCILGWGMKCILPGIFMVSFTSIVWGNS